MSPGAILIWSHQRVTSEPSCWEPTRALLRRLAQRTSTGGVLIGDSIDPASDDPVDLGYEER
jgi:hypothetical protein